jgi:hypothetical protein
MESRPSLQRLEAWQAAGRIPINFEEVFESHVLHEASVGLLDQAEGCE